MELFEDVDYQESTGKKIKVSGRPSWCSEELWETLCMLMEESKGQLVFDFVFSKAERKVLKKRKPI